MASNRLTPRWVTWLYIVLMIALTLSGLGQMPIFTRYYVAQIPGMGWTGDFYFTHKMHYVAAAVLLFLLFWTLGRHLTVWHRRHRLTASGWIRALLLLGIVITGLVRVIKNEPTVSFSPTLTLLVDWTHLGFVMLLGMAALVAALRGRSAWLATKTP